MIELIERARKFESRTAIIDAGGIHTYDYLLRASAAVASHLMGRDGDLEEVRVAFLVPSGFSYAAVQWGIWRAGGVAVPLCTQHPEEELEHVISNSGAEMLIADGRFLSILAPLAKKLDRKLVSVEKALKGKKREFPDIQPERRAMIIYTSGTTGKPKGAVTTHANIQAQIESLVEAWGWSGDDRILNVLPLHHVHGIVNVLLCALWSGAVCEMMPGFDADLVWESIASGDLTLFMAVPTIYVKLIQAWEEKSKSERGRLSEACRKMRLFVSGSAALPVTVFERWREVSGHNMLERYGMTEIGMALSNPLNGERRPGTVGTPLPGVEVRLVDEDGESVEQGKQGEIHVRGPAVFREYWGNATATADSLSGDWFRTGDIAVIENGYYRILGRSSVDIIKTGGFKVSALEIEEVLLRHKSIAEAAVVGLPDPVWGERVAAAIVITPGNHITPGWLRGWAKQHLADYKVPTRLLTLKSLPRNAMGKVNKPALRNLFELEERS